MGRARMGYPSMNGVWFSPYALCVPTFPTRHCDAAYKRHSYCSSSSTSYQPLPTQRRLQGHAARLHLDAEGDEHQDDHSEGRARHGLYVSLQVCARGVEVHVLVEIPDVPAPLFGGGQSDVTTPVFRETKSEGNERETVRERGSDMNEYDLDNGVPLNMQFLFSYLFYAVCKRTMAKRAQSQTLTTATDGGYGLSTTMETAIAVHQHEHRLLFHTTVHQ